MPEFKPCVIFSDEGDFISIYIKDVSSYAEVLTPYLSIFRDDNTNEIIGCQICGVKKSLDICGFKSIEMLNDVILENSRLKEENAVLQSQVNNADINWEQQKLCTNVAKKELGELKDIINNLRFDLECQIRYNIDLVNRQIQDERKIYQLEKTIKKLLKERREMIDEINAIYARFDELNINTLDDL